MTLQEEITRIKNDTSLDYNGKVNALSKFLTTQEISSLLPKQQDLPVLKQKIDYTKGKTLYLSIHLVFFNEILKGKKKQEYRDYSDYYIKRCTYVENGKRYLVPFTTIAFYVGKGKNARQMTVSVSNITCNGVYFIFHLGKVLSTNVKTKEG